MENVEIFKAIGLCTNLCKETVNVEVSKKEVGSGCSIELLETKHAARWLSAAFAEPSPMAGNVFRSF
jgi:hypothetical protein